MWARISFNNPKLYKNVIEIVNTWLIKISRGKFFGID
jgi:hypothetical protein